MLPEGIFKKINKLVVLKTHDLGRGKAKRKKRKRERVENVRGKPIERKLSGREGIAFLAQSLSLCLGVDGFRSDLCQIEPLKALKFHCSFPWTDRSCWHTKLACGEKLSDYNSDKVAEKVTGRGTDDMLNWQKQNSRSINWQKKER